MNRVRDLGEASRALESTLVKQLLQSSGAFKGTEGVAGASLNSEMFMEVLADAVAKDGGFGLAKMLEKSMGPAQDAQNTQDTRAGKPPAPAGPPPLHPYMSPSGEPGVSSGFGPRLHPVDGTPSFHTGLDLRAAEGAPILAARGGVVKSAGPRGGYGNAIEVDHGDGVTTLYAHASRVDVQPGDTIAPGDKVGEVGDTGKTTGPHLHFEVRVGGRAIDPKKALNAYGIRAEATLEESPKQASLLP
jgi:murein DD-endopeptidase MepM/ murein hydrolase activator NlpD